jgi:dGTPase
VAQIARSLCRALALHEDLAEAVALAHDLGHTPFGHSGQDALHMVMKPYGGFEHNRQSLRIVEKLESRYPDVPGLNLSYETREGIVKHNSPHDTPRNADLAEFHLHEQATLEAQIGNLADEIAYNNHDIDDGYRAHMLDLDGLKTIRLFKQHYDLVCEQYSNIAESFMVSETIRRMINFLILDVIEETQKRIKDNKIQDLDNVRACKEPLVGFSKSVRRMNGEMKKYLFQHMYSHYRVARMASKAERVIQGIFRAYMERPQMLPDSPRIMCQSASDEEAKARIIADYIAGMTDRYALEEWDRLFDIHART